MNEYRQLETILQELPADQKCRFEYFHETEPAPDEEYSPEGTPEEIRAYVAQGYEWIAEAEYKYIRNENGMNLYRNENAGFWEKEGRKQWGDIYELCEDGTYNTDYEETHMIKANLPASKEAEEAGTGEGVYMQVGPEVLTEYNSDMGAGVYTGILDNDSMYYPGLKHGTRVPIRMNGPHRPTVLYNWLADHYKTADNGGTVYTMEQWYREGTFQAATGQEIDPDIYFTMRNALPPRTAGKRAMQAGGDACGIRVAEGFLMGEPITSSNEGMLYRLFLMNGKGRTFYAGLFPVE